MNHPAPGGRAALHGLVARLRGQSGLAAHLADDEPRLLAHLRARAAELGLARTGASDGGLAALVARLAHDTAEYARLEASFSPPETWLFRYPESIEFVRGFARAFERRAANRPLRALVVGAGGWCEPCSVAAALLEELGGAARFSIEAVDRNPEVFAAPARFSGMHLRGGVPAWAERWFRRDGDAAMPSPELLARVTARTDDAERVAARTEGQHDLVFFRNVAIYLEDARRMRLVAALASRLAVDGAMLVGHSEVSLAAQVAGLVPSEAAGSFALIRVAPRAAEKPSVSAGGNAMPTGPQPPSAEVRSPRAVGGNAPPGTVGADGRRAPAGAPRDPRATALPAPDDPLARARVELAASPADPARHLAMARILLAAGDSAGAEAALGRALYLDRRHEASLVLAAELAERRGAVEEARRLRERALRVHLEREEWGAGDSEGNAPGA